MIGFCELACTLLECHQEGNKQQGAMVPLPALIDFASSLLTGVGEVAGQGAAEAVVPGLDQEAPDLPQRAPGAADCSRQIVPLQLPAVHIKKTQLRVARLACHFQVQAPRPGAATHSASSWRKAVDRPQLGGSVPWRAESFSELHVQRSSEIYMRRQIHLDHEPQHSRQPTHRVRRLGKEPLRPHSEGRLLPRGFPDSERKRRSGSAAGSPQLGGSLPLSRF